MRSFGSTLNIVSHSIRRDSRRKEYLGVRQAQLPGPVDLPPNFSLHVSRL
jgi:hypothetical protein